MTSPIIAAAISFLAEALSSHTVCWTAVTGTAQELTGASCEPWAGDFTGLVLPTGPIQSTIPRQTAALMAYALCGTTGCMARNRPTRASGVCVTEACRSFAGIQFLFQHTDTVTGELALGRRNLGTRQIQAADSGQVSLRPSAGIPAQLQAMSLEP
mmetsp:Transcript_20272/g.57030  ORF Transcript_20272/g.57030 Transcript_20272/m.57030 type:complete len:156 (+) Transcript_20272:1934-2401(+)